MPDHKVAPMTKRNEGITAVRQAGGDVQGQALVWNHIMAVIDSLVLKCAVKLEIFDVIHRHGRPISLPEIAAALPSSCFSQPTLRRFMRYLSHMRLVLDHDGDDEREPSFTLSPAAAAYLVKGSKLSLTSFVQILLDKNFLEPFTPSTSASPAEVTSRLSS
ncbi:hypothetical protein HPP92_008885 [Vanilla planifolia]|uniref:O-methyltransferase dimerisation domain-containing protein n=1 Tax=Vanilla planifolia TaxID=51239 RepID=A0A835R395_VANPL|nr:hypothetical protein HPP92_008885 [Vanilla planifolia]